jgi:hypothetical protein
MPCQAPTTLTRAAILYCAKYLQCCLVNRPPRRSASTLSPVVDEILQRSRHAWKGLPVDNEAIARHPALLHAMISEAEIYIVMYSNNHQLIQYNRTVLAISH